MAETRELTIEDIMVLKLMTFNFGDKAVEGIYYIWNVESLKLLLDVRGLTVQYATLVSRLHEGVVLEETVMAKLFKILDNNAYCHIAPFRNTMNSVLNTERLASFTNSIVGHANASQHGIDAELDAATVKQGDVEITVFGLRLDDGTGVKVSGEGIKTRTWYILDDKIYIFGDCYTEPLRKLIHLYHGEKSIHQALASYVMSWCYMDATEAVAQVAKILGFDEEDVVEKLLQHSLSHPFIKEL